MACHRSSPSTTRSTYEITCGSSKIRAALSNEMPCFRRLMRSLASSQAKTIRIYKIVAHSGGCAGCCARTLWTTYMTGSTIQTSVFSVLTLSPISPCSSSGRLTVNRSIEDILIGYGGHRLQCALEDWSQGECRALIRTCSVRGIEAFFTDDGTAGDCGKVAMRKTLHYWKIGYSRHSLIPSSKSR